MNSREWFVDAGYWIAWANSRDVWHARARALASGLRRPLVITEPVLLEVGNTFARPPWRAVASSLLSRIRANPNITTVPVDADLARRALDLYIARPDKSWGLTDCAPFIVMQDHGILEALAADRPFTQAGFRALLCES